MCTVTAETQGVNIVRRAHTFFKDVEVKRIKIKAFKAKLDYRRLRISFSLGCQIKLKYASVQVCKDAPMHLCTYAHIYAGIQVCEYASMQVYNYASIQV